MRRGITPVVAIALLLGMTVAASGGAYTFISQAQQSAQEEASQALATGVAVRGMRCDDARAEATLKNTGDASLTATTLDAFLYRDGTLVATSEVDVSGADVLEPGGLTTVSLPFVLDPGTRYTVEIRFPQDDVSVERTCQARLADLVAHWDFEAKVPGQVTDAARDNDGTFHNFEKNGTLTGFGFNASSGWVDGRVGPHALRFHGNMSDHVDLGTNHVLDNGSAAVSLWFNFDGYISGHYSDDFNLIAFSGDEYKREISVHASSTEPHYIQAETDTNGDYFPPNSGTHDIFDDTWYHLAVSFTAAGAQWYLDGEAIDDPKSTIDDLTVNTLGGTADGGDAVWFNGEMDDVRFYDRPLSAEEAQGIFSGDGPRDGLVGEWTLDEGNGTIAHDTSSWKGGAVGDHALAFDGADDYVDAGPVTLTDNLTLAAWINPDAIGDDNGLVRIGSTLGSQAAGNALFYLNDASSVSYEYTDQNGQRQRVTFSSVDLPLDTWTHLAVTHAFDDTIALYRNGVQEATAASVNVTAPNGTIYLSSEQNYGNYERFDGTIDDVRVYGTALSPDQVAALHEAAG